MELLNECNVIKYSAYRAAAKVRALQRALHMEHVRLNVVCGVFYRHRLLPSQNEDTIDRRKLEAVVSDILFASHKETRCNMDIDLATEKIVQIITDIYDRNPEVRVQVICAKVALTVLCSARLQEKYQYLFQQSSDHNSCLNKQKMEVLLTKLSEIMEYLSESLAFGLHLVSATVDSCYQYLEGDLGITEESFICWLLKEPQLVVWLSTLYRLQAAESVCHHVKCDVCKIYPVRGLRYKCLLCFNYNQCQSCFFLGEVSKGHKLKHPVQEYCFETSSKEATLAFLKMLRNKLRRNPCKNIYCLPTQPQILPCRNRSASASTESSSSTLNTHSSEHNEETDSISMKLRETPNAAAINPQAELQSIIHNLEEENRQLLAEIEELNETRVENCLRDHRVQIGAQVERLKLLKFHLARVNDLLMPLKPLESKRSYRQHLCLLESTPVVPKAMRQWQNGRRIPPDLDSISPIVKDVDRVTDGSHLLSYQNDHCGNSVTASASTLPSLSERSLGDLSTHLYKGSPNKTPVVLSGLSVWSEKAEMPNGHFNEETGDLDSIIERLQNVLASNMSLQDNSHLQEAAMELEELLSGLIKNVEERKQRSSRTSAETQIFV